MKLVFMFLLMFGVLTAGQILVHGHRGARALRPENTIPAFEFAIRAGADVLELDLAVTKDDVLVASHDPILNPEICRGPAGNAAIRELTFAELSQWDCGSLQNPKFPKQVPASGARIPSLDQILALAGQGSFHFNIETKIFQDRPELTPTPEKFTQLLLEAIRRRKLESRVIVQSFDFRTLHAMKKLDPEIRLAALVEKEPVDFVHASRIAGAGIISPEQRLVTPERVRAAHAAGLQVVPWTANTAADWDVLIQAGVDAIITDDPAALIAYLKQNGLR